MTDAERPDARQPGVSERLASIAAFGQVMNAARSSVDVAEAVAEEIRLATDASSVSICRWEPQDGVVWTLVNVGDLADWEERRPTDETYSIDSHDVLLDVIVGRRASVYRTDDPACPQSQRALLERLGKRSSLIVAIRYGGRVWGELYLTRSADKPPFTDADLEFADGIAGFVAMAFAQGERLDAVSRVAFKDTLTGLANRGAMDDALAAAFDDRRRDGGDIGLVLVDVNGLKNVNDVSGHDAGDRLLVAVGGVMRSAASSAADGLAARLGGDEFCVLLRDTTMQESVQVAEYLCDEALRITPDGVSCGVACTADSSLAIVDSPRRLLRITDAAQYRAKRARSGRPVVAGREIPQPPGRVASSAARRTYREGGEDVVADLLETGLRTLDHTRQQGAQQRLRVLAESVCAALNASAWFTACTSAGSDAVVTRDGESYRPSNTAPIWDQDELVGASWSLDQYPQTAHVLDGGGFVIVSGDPDADTDELAVLADSGYQAVLAAGATESCGTGWLLEIYADDLSADFSGLASALRVLVVAALAVRPTGNGDGSRPNGARR